MNSEKRRHVRETADGHRDVTRIAQSTRVIDAQRMTVETRARD